MPETSATTTTAPHFPVVGVGASAGGIEALSELLSGLPPKLGLALVVIQHLAPGKPSKLVDILQRQTKMNVEEAGEQIVVPGSVYVIPPGKTLTILHDRLMLSQREAGRKPHRPINDFFKSLAENLGSDAIGVVLSGAGWDGTEGLKAIKAKGGTTFTQAPISAVFPTMPQFASVAADFVLTPAEIAQELVRITRKTLAKTPEEGH